MDNWLPIEKIVNKDRNEREAERWKEHREWLANLTAEPEEDISDVIEFDELDFSAWDEEVW